MWKVTIEDDRLVFTPFFDEEPKKVSVSTLYGEMVMDKVRDKFWSYNEIGKKDDEIRELKAEYQKLRERYAQCEMDVYHRDEELHDLKLENDRLRQREEKMMRVIRSIACDYGDCEDCLFLGSDNLPCGDAGDDYKACVNLLKELEDIG